MLAKYSTPNWSEQVFVIKKFKSTVPRTYVINILMQKKLVEIFTKKNSKNKSKGIQNLKSNEEKR